MEDPPHHGAEPKVVYTAPSCTFDDAAWKLLFWGTKCADDGDASVDGGVFSCASESDGGVAVQTDSGGDASPASNDDAGKLVAPGSDSDPPAAVARDKAADRTKDLSSSGRPQPTASESSSSCSFEPRAATGSFSGIALVAFGVSVIRRRRRQRS